MSEPYATIHVKYETVKTVCEKALKRIDQARAKIKYQFITDYKDKLNKPTVINWLRKFFTGKTYYTYADTMAWLDKKMKECDAAGFAGMARYWDYCYHSAFYSTQERQALTLIQGGKDDENGIVTIEVEVWRSLILLAADALAGDKNELERA